MDVDTIVSSTAKTGRLVVIEEGPPSGGYAAEVIASAVERLGHIAARRVTMPDLPIPFSGVLEDAYLPKPHRIEDAARTLLGDTGARIATAAQQRRSS
jgi:pyruvate/2-oxoglutarate/acetoin dehydrogenase E1 component